MNGDLPTIYARRFSDADAPAREAVWREITRFLQRWIDPSATVLDLACDRGDFVNHVIAADRIGVDIRDVRKHLDQRLSASSRATVWLCSIRSRPRRSTSSS